MLPKVALRLSDSVDLVLPHDASNPIVRTITHLVLFPAPKNCFISDPLFINKAVKKIRKTTAHLLSLWYKMSRLFSNVVGDKMKKTITSLFLSFLFLIPTLAVYGADTEAADAIWHDVRVSSVNITGIGCEDVFVVNSYEVQHFLMGPTRRTSVIHLRDRSGAPVEELGFFEGVSFIGLYGGSGDVFVDRDISRDGVVYKAHLEGMLDRRVIYVQIKVKRMAGEQLLCEASADFTGFN
jgi:hypothetical protein